MPSKGEVAYEIYAAQRESWSWALRRFREALSTLQADFTMERLNAIIQNVEALQSKYPKALTDEETATLIELSTAGN